MTPSPVWPLLSARSDLLCGGIGLSDRNLLSSGGRHSLDSSAFDVVFIGSVLTIGCTKFSGEVVGEDDLVVGRVDGTADESALFRGKGNSRGGGIGRMFAAPS